MAAKGVSRFRNLFAEPFKPERQFIDAQPAANINDSSNGVAASTIYMAFPWASTGAGRVVIHPLEKFGKMNATPPCLQGHSGPVIDVAFSPFDPTLLATASEDCTVRIWSLPKSDGLTENQNESAVTLQGHGKKVNQLRMHPSAANVLATVSADMTVRLWDIEKGAESARFGPFAGDALLAADWNIDGSCISVMSKERKDCSLFVVDTRTSGPPGQGAVCHNGGKAGRVTWMKRLNAIVTCGFTAVLGRELTVWDPRNLAGGAKQRLEVESGSGALMPMPDEDSNVIFVAGKGDGNVRYLEVTASTLAFLGEWSSGTPARGFCLLPKQSCDLRKSELARGLKVDGTKVVPVSFIVPRKNAESVLQTDVYPPTFSTTPALTAGAFFSGERVAPLEAVLSFDGISAGAPSPHSTTLTSPPAGPAPAPRPPAAAAAAPHHPPAAASSATAPAARAAATKQAVADTVATVLSQSERYAPAVYEQAKKVAQLRKELAEAEESLLRQAGTEDPAALMDLERQRRVAELLVTDCAEVVDAAKRVEAAKAAAAKEQQERIADSAGQGRARAASINAAKAIGEELADRAAARESKGALAAVDAEMKRAQDAHQRSVVEVEAEAQREREVSSRQARESMDREKKERLDAIEADKALDEAERAKAREEAKVALDVEQRERSASQVRRGVLPAPIAGQLGDAAAEHERRAAAAAKAAAEEAARNPPPPAPTPKPHSPPAKEEAPAGSRASVAPGGFAGDRGSVMPGSLVAAVPGEFIELGGGVAAVPEKIVAQWNRVRSDDDPLNWLALGYDETGTKGLIIGSGTGGLDELVQMFTPDKVVYGGFRCTAVDDRGSGVISRRAKFVSIIWCGADVKPKPRAKVAMHKGIFGQVFTSKHVDIEASEVLELSKQKIEDKLQASTGAHRPNRYDF